MTNWVTDLNPNIVIALNVNIFNTIIFKKKIKQDLKITLGCLKGHNFKYKETKFKGKIMEKIYKEKMNQKLLQLYHYWKKQKGKKCHQR